MTARKDSEREKRGEGSRQRREDLQTGAADPERHSGARPALRFPKILDKIETYCESRGAWEVDPE